MRVGWCCTALEAAICFETPKRFIPDKDGSSVARGFLSCPAIRNYFASTYYVSSPFSLQLTCRETEAGPVVQPVYPFTSLTPGKVSEFVKIEPKSSWRTPDALAMQVVSPYLFFADDPIIIRQDPVQLVTPSSHSWRLIPGKFNIYDWQRPLNWAVEWNFKIGDFMIRTGEPIYFISFEHPSNSSNASIELVECDTSPELEKQLKQTRGVTSIQRGVMPLLSKAKAKRNGLRLLPK